MGNPPTKPAPLKSKPMLYAKLALLAVLVGLIYALILALAGAEKQFGKTELARLSEAYNVYLDQLPIATEERTKRRSACAALLNEAAMANETNDKERLKRTLVTLAVLDEDRKSPLYMFAIKQRKRGGK